MKGKKYQRVSFESDWCGTATAMTNHGFGGSLQVFGVLVDLSSHLFPLGVSQILINEPGICVYSSFSSSSYTRHGIAFRLLPRWGSSGAKFRTQESSTLACESTTPSMTRFRAIT